MLRYRISYLFIWKWSKNLWSKNYCSSSPYFSMPFEQSQKTKSHEPLQRSCSSPVGASAGIKTKRASAPMIAQIMVIIFDFIIWKFIVWKFIVKFDENLPIVLQVHPCREILFLLLLSLFRNMWKFGILIYHWKIHPLHPKIHSACNCFDTDVS